MELTEGTDRYSLDTLALALHLTGRNDEAIAAQRKAISLVPGGDPVNRAGLSTSLVKYLSAGGGEREAKEVIRECVRSLEAASDSAADFVLKIASFPRGGIGAAGGPRLGQEPLDE